MSNFWKKIEEYKAQGKTYVVAEVGSNWKSIQDLFGAVQLAKACGADAVKFQYFTESELFGPVEEIDKDFPLQQLREKANAAGIDFLCTAFSVKGLKEVDKFVPAHKVASSEMAHKRLLEAVKATGKPIILSTGAYFIKDIARTVKFLNGANVIIMHCNVQYPAKFVNLQKLKEIKDTFGGIVGFSDHTTSIDLVPLHMKSLGVTVYEKHFNPFGYADTPDAPHSLNTKEFETMVALFRGSLVVFDEENEARLKHIRRVVALKEILPGETLKEGDNIGIFRSKILDANGLHPFGIEALEGKIIGHHKVRGDGISIMDLK